MGADNTGEDITIGEYNKASSGTVLSMQPASGNINFSDATLVVDAKDTFPPANAIRAQTNDGAAVLAINSSSSNAAVSATNSFTGGGVSGNCDSGFGVMGRSKQGPAVIGITGGGGPVTNEVAQVGVLGWSFNGTGVKAKSTEGLGVRAESIDYIGVFATARGNRAGVFLSGTVSDTYAPGVQTSQEGIAQVRLVPSSSPQLPSKGQIGDLFVHRVPKNQPPNAPVNLYLCVRSNPVQWQQVQLAPKIYPGGSTAP